MKHLLMVFALSAGLSFGQTMVETTTAAAGGSAAGVAGKSVSDGLDKVRGALEKATKSGAAEVRRTTGAVQFDRSPAGAATTPRKDLLATVAEGATRQNLIAIAGRPASRIIMGEGGHLMEVYTYRGAGSVRLTDGAVTAVHITGN
jgi:hypothetical protein